MCGVSYKCYHDDFDELCLTRSLPNDLLANQTPSQLPMVDGRVNIQVETPSYKLQVKDPLGTGVAIKSITMH